MSTTKNYSHVATFRQLTQLKRHDPAAASSAERLLAAGFPDAAAHRIRQSMHQLLDRLIAARRSTPTEESRSILLTANGQTRVMEVGGIASRLTELFKEMAKKWQVQIIAQEVMPDHVHLFVSAPPKYSPSKLAQLFKGTTAYVLRLEFPEVKQVIYKVGTLWSPGYYVGTAGNVSSQTIRKYIEECQKL